MPAEEKALSLLEPRRMPTCAGIATIDSPNFATSENCSQRTDNAGLFAATSNEILPASQLRHFSSDEGLRQHTGRNDFFHRTRTKQPRNKMSLTVGGTSSIVHRTPTSMNGKREDTDYCNVSWPAATLSREDRPTRIYCIIEDVFPLAKISAVAHKLNVKVGIVGRGQDLVAELAKLPEQAWPSLIVVDLNFVQAKPLTLIPRLRSMLTKSASIIGLVLRTQADLKLRGANAGCNTVLAQPAFWQDLRNLLRRYGRTDEDRERLFV